MDTILLVVGAVVVLGILYLAFKPKKEKDKPADYVPPTTEEIIKMKPPKIGGIFGSNPPPTDKG